MEEPGDEHQKHDAGEGKGPRADLVEKACPPRASSAPRQSAPGIIRRPVSMAPRPRKLCRNSGRKNSLENITMFVTTTMRFAMAKERYLNTRRSRSGFSDVSSR